MMILKLKHREFGFQTIATVGLLAVCVVLHIFTLTIYIAPSYRAQPFYSKITPPHSLDIEESFKVVSSSGISYHFKDGNLELQRTGNEVPTINLDASFCQLLPLNALVSLEVSSLSKGGLYLRLDRNGENSYDTMVWRSFPAGRSAALFSIGADNCTGAKITLAKRTNRLTLGKLQISELKIHRHGKPI